MKYSMPLPKPLGTSIEIQKHGKWWPCEKMHGKRCKWHPRYRAFLKAIRFTSRAFRASKSIKRSLFGKLRLYATQRSLRRLELEGEALLRVASAVQEVWFCISTYLTDLSFSAFVNILTEQQRLSLIRLGNDGRPTVWTTRRISTARFDSVSRESYAEYSRRAQVDERAANEMMGRLWTRVLSHLTHLSHIHIGFWDSGRLVQFPLPQGVSLSSRPEVPGGGSQQVLRRYAVSSNTKMTATVLDCLGASRKTGITKLSFDYETMIYKTNAEQIPNWTQVDLSSLTKFKSGPLEWDGTEYDEGYDVRWYDYMAGGRRNYAATILPVILGKSHNSLREISLEGNVEDLTGGWNLSVVDHLRFPRLVHLRLMNLNIPGASFRRLLSEMPHLRQLDITDCTANDPPRTEPQNWKMIFAAIRNRGSPLLLRFWGEDCAVDDEDFIRIRVDTGDPGISTGAHSPTEKSLARYISRQGDWDDDLEHGYPQGD